MRMTHSDGATAGTTTHRSTTGRTRARSGGATSRSGAGWSRREADADRSSWDAARAGCCCRSLAPARIWPASIGPRPMLARAIETRPKRLPRARRPPIVRGDIRAPAVCAPAASALVIAPYGMLQSLIVRPRSRRRARRGGARAAARRTARRRSRARSADVATNPAPRVTLRGRHGAGAAHHAHRVRPPGSAPRADDLRRGVRRAAAADGVGARRFYADVPHAADEAVLARLERAGFAVEAVLGDYRGGPWDVRADVWVILARRTIVTIRDVGCDCRVCGARGTGESAVETRRALRAMHLSNLRVTLLRS